MTNQESLIALTADIVASHVGHNSVSINDIPGVISSVYGALQKLRAPQDEPTPELPKGAVTARASVKADRLISMIDGKPYKMLKRHLSLNGYTPESYRKTFGLPNDYPMVAATYAETRRALALKIGLGRKPKVLPEPIKVARKPRAPKKVLTET